MNDLIRFLQEKEDVSFEEAEYYLRKAGGNLDKAVFLIQKRKHSWLYRTVQKIKEVFQSIWQYRFIICKAEKVYVNIPFYLCLFLVLLAGANRVEYTLFMLILVIVVIVSGAEMKLTKKTERKLIESPIKTRVNYQSVSKVDDISKNNLKSEQTKTERKNEEKELNLDSKQSNSELDDYSEIIIK